MIPCLRCKNIAGVLNYHTPSEQWQIQCNKCKLLMRNKNKDNLIDDWTLYKENK